MNHYLDYRNWHRLFPLTIRGVKYVDEKNGAMKVEVDHRYEGKVINILTVLSGEDIQLQEFKPKYNATFVNRFHAIPAGTLYTVIADISLKGIYELAAPFIHALIKNRIKKFVLQPMKSFSETKAGQP